MAGADRWGLFQGTDKFLASVGVCFSEQTNFKLLGKPQKPKMCPLQGENRQIHLVLLAVYFHNI